jgi:uncharacterized OB-fold protein/acyl dehydratase
MTDDAFYAELQELVGLEIGPPVPAPDEVNVPMIRHWCEAIGDTNPVYLDADAAAVSVHGGLVAPPTMLQAWVMTGFPGPRRDGEGPYHQMNALLFSRGFTSVVATNSEQTYERYLRPGDRLTMRTVIDDISPEKTTALGAGHFITTRQDYFDGDGELVGSMKFRIIRFRPAAKSTTPSPTDPDDRPQRPLPATTLDNQWWFDALDEGRLLIQRCTSCGRLRHPTGPMCPDCRSLHWDTVEAAGRGTVHSHITVHYPQVPGFDYPLTVVLVELDEGIRMVMNTADNQPAEIGQRVRIDVHQYGPGLRLPMAIITGSAGNDVEGAT